MILKKVFTVLTILSVAGTVFAGDENGLALIPWPQHAQQLDGAFTLTPQTRIYADRPSRRTADLVAERLRQSTGYALTIRWKPLAGVLPPNSILFTTKDANTNLGLEGYQLTVTTNSVVIRAPAQAGVFYGGETFLQMLPEEIFSPKVIAKVDWRAPCAQIEDWPRFPWRGLMLDVSRHFFNTSEVEAILDEMALYKLNRFHWHLVDDQGWRIQIKRYPRLTEIGAWRKHCAILPPDPAIPSPAWTRPTADKFGPDGRYGGFYTQKEIRQIVAYAAARHIVVVPEIEMPGHSEAALAAYPQLSCFGGPYSTDNNLNIHDSIYDPSNPETFRFLDNVLAEVFELFPGPYVHIGGDEVRKDYWNRSAACRALMKQEGLHSEDQLQSYFIQRMETFINAHGKTLIGWSEILKGGLATNAVVMDWIGGGKQAAEAGHNAIMTPVDNCYLDHFHEPGSSNNFAPLRRVYSFEPVPAGLPDADRAHILGLEGVLWTEYIASLPHAQYMIFPRVCALAEVGWSARSARDWDDFRRRLSADEERLDELGVNYRRAGEAPIVGMPPGE